MIKEDYCSYEVSKLLKEKGFDELTTFVWYQHLPISINCRNLANKKARDYFYYNETTEHNSSYRNSSDKPEYIYGDIFSCPTHQMAMKWLRDVHNLCIAPYAAAYRYGFTIDKCDTGSNICNDDVINGELPNYEDAVEAALKYCLTELI